MEDLVEVAGRRRNIIPIMADAAHPEEEAPLVEEVDFIFQDVASPPSRPRLRSGTGPSSRLPAASSSWSGRDP
jgi:hypothetical protein